MFSSLKRASLVPSIIRALAASAVLATAADARPPFSGCGTLIQGVTCVLFQADSGGLWLLNDYGSFVVGDVVYVTGNQVPGCISICMQGNGCIEFNTIAACAICACTGFCFGDASSPVACPCGNFGATGHGCANSVNPAGALITGSGTASLSADTVVLSGSDMPDSSALYFQGTAMQGGGSGVVFGDGKRCAGGTTVRLGTKTNVAGASSYPGAGDPSISVRGMVTMPGQRYYQVWYRNAAAYCTTATFNLSNGQDVTWGL